MAQSAPPTALERVVVTANRTPQPLATVLADLTVIDRDEIERTGVAGVADLLARHPGIEITRNGGLGNSTSVFIRGGETRHTAVYVDGVRLDSQSTGGAVWEQIPLDQIERIEILRGPAAAIYGSDAIAGVVQLFTKRGQGPARPTASLTVGSYNTVQGQVGVSGSANALNYALSGVRGRSDGFDATKPGAFGHNPDKDGWKRSSVQGRVGYQINAEHRVDASLLASNLKSSYDGSATTNDENHHTLRTGNVVWQGRWNADSTTRLQVGQTRSTYETQPSFYRTETTLNDYTLLHEQKVGGNVFTGTLERREDKLFNPETAFSAAFGGKRHQDAIGLGWRGDFGDHGLQAHVRRDDDSEFGGKSTGSLAWGWKFLPEWRVTAAAATSFRVPTLYQRFSEYGVASLVPESGRNVELGLRWAAAGGEASLTAWRNKVINLIEFGPPGPCLNAFGCYQNVGRAELEGVTLAGRTDLDGVTLRASLGWHDPRNVDTDKVLRRRAKRLATFGAETVLAGWTVGTEVQAAGLRYENAANTQVLGGFGLVNLYVSTQLNPGMSLEARIDNLGDKSYELARNYATARRNGQVLLRWSL
ncbi:TonB-dependent receptor [uncultured Methylibium sp.]|uniref:TonB-dependent receptor domain-containing protein n=1 Tax=uncultured Methylibium sp. TaxID=381093 RepID=UPI0025F5C138|nr:TonB-dependent receptor [uncultured Methylibium sp.]